MWIRDPESGQLNLRSDLNRAVWKAFQVAGIGVPFTLKEVRIFRGDPPSDALPAGAVKPPTT